MPDSRPLKWLLLTHHLPPDPPYFRAKVGRRLERIGAVALKNSVYALPSTPDTLEDFQWLFQEIEREGGSATLSEASFLDRVTDARLVARFQDARESDYRGLVDSARDLLGEARADETPARRADAKLPRLVERLEAVVAIDFFDAPGRPEAERAVDQVRGISAGRGSEERPRERPTEEVGRGRTWVTRAGAKVDRISSAWLIRRFIDPEAVFRFVAGPDEAPAEGELRFDMFEGEFTHVGDACTFETLLERFDLDDPALTALGEIVHDIDCKDDKFGRPEVAGVASMVDGIVRTCPADTTRLERGAELLDGLHAHFSQGT